MHIYKLMTNSSTDKISFGIEAVDEDKLFQVILEENIGDCPDFQCEFLSVASMAAPASSKSHADSPPFIGVIACGPAHGKNFANPVLAGQVVLILYLSRLTGNGKR